MKLSIDVECTPEEARRFLGLPDLTPVHQAFVERLTSAASEGVTAETFAEMAKAWGPMSDVGAALWRQMLNAGGGTK